MLIVNIWCGHGIVTVLLHSLAKLASWNLVFLENIKNSLLDISKIGKYMGKGMEIGTQS